MNTVGPNGMHGYPPQNPFPPQVTQAPRAPTNNDLHPENPAMKPGGMALNNFPGQPPVRMQQMPPMGHNQPLSPNPVGFNPMINKIPAKTMNQEQFSGAIRPSMHPSLPGADRDMNFSGPPTSNASLLGHPSMAGPPHLGKPGQTMPQPGQMPPQMGHIMPQSGQPMPTQAGLPPRMPYSDNIMQQGRPSAPQGQSPYDFSSMKEQIPRMPPPQNAPPSSVNGVSSPTFTQYNRPPGQMHQQSPPQQFQQPGMPPNPHQQPPPQQFQQPPSQQFQQQPPSQFQQQPPLQQFQQQHPPHQQFQQAGMPPPQQFQQPGMPSPQQFQQPGMPQKPMQQGPYAQSQLMYQQQQQQSNKNRLDPEQMPSPIQVAMDNEKTRGGVFYTNQRGVAPPLVTTNFTTVDQGNANPAFMRSTMYCVPATVELMKQCAVPFGLVISPMAKLKQEEYYPPIVDMGELGPVRCIRCKAYMSPLMQFVDGGRRFYCLLCKQQTEVPQEYFQHLDHTGQRVDREHRPELSLGAYEFIATKDYCRNNTYPKPPALIFIIDVSYNNVKSGMLHLLCQEMKNIVKNLPIDIGETKSKMRVGFITYNSVVHFYNIKGSLAQPKMLVVGDVNEMFMPLLDGFLADPDECADMIDLLMQQIPVMFGETRETETILGPAIQAGLEALKSSECPGKLLVFHSSLPIAEAPGKLKNRDDRKLLGTEKEKTVLAPQITYYNNLAQECVGAGCSVDLFAFNNSYMDLATIGQISRLTGGEVYKYTYFQASTDGPRLIEDVIRNVKRNIAFDAIMRVRTSTGVRPTEFYGHFFMSNTTDMELASIDSEKAVALEIKHDDKLTEEEGVFIQVALLYTSCGGQRRLRVLNLALKTCTLLADLYRECDLDTLVNFLAKQSVTKLLENTPKQIKDGLVSRCAHILACYRKNCATPSSAGQLILPESMKLLPLYINCILKNDAISGGSDLSIDDRSFVMYAVNAMDTPSSVVFFYPRLIPVHNLNLENDGTPLPIRCTVEKLRDDGAYLLENGIHMFMWVGANVSTEWIHNVFGDHLAAKVDIDRTSLPHFDNATSVALRDIIEKIRNKRQRSMKLTIIPQRDKLEVVFKQFLVEDKGLMDTTGSYVDFLCHIHKEIRNILS